MLQRRAPARASSQPRPATAVSLYISLSLPLLLAASFVPSSNASQCSISTGGYHTCALGNELHCWGDGGYGQLGRADGERGPVGGNAGETGLAAFPASDLGTDVTILEVSCGQYMGCALLSGGIIKCWGNAQGGILGNGEASTWTGDDAGEMGDVLTAVDLGTGLAALQISCYNGHCCALLTGGLVKCWGNNDHGQLGQGDMAHRGDQSGEMGDYLPAVILGARAMAVAAGWRNTCALLENGLIKCWGGDSIGVAADQMGDALAPVDLGAGRTAVALARSLPAVDLGTGRYAVAISASSASCAILADNGGVKCWGLNNRGQLGIGDTDSRGDDLGEMVNRRP
ncbi:regulator of chromosome condensation 1/beta-lactamase-inhibitor protein II [Baffinella frigidus]|nr:regulator of chromosome condensation 1/beta-lactamase-inhibitor protein II [Cryptophyta sp. CCMP2293]